MSELLIPTKVPTIDDNPDFLTSFDEDLFPIPALMNTFDTTGFTSLDISSLDVLIRDVLHNVETPLLSIYEEGGLEAGCGGRLWLAGKLLSLYLINNLEKISLQRKQKIRKIVDLGSGTGIVGIAVAVLLKYLKDHDETQIYLTDLPLLIPMLEKNTHLNNVELTCSAKVLDWFDCTLPQYLTQDGEKVDLILVADCVYDEKLFSVLIQTLLMLCNLNHKLHDEETKILFTSRKRRKSNARFFKILRKFFNMTEIVDYEGYELFQKERCHLFELVLKR